MNGKYRVLTDTSIAQTIATDSNVSTGAQASVKRSVGAQLVRDKFNCAKEGLGKMSAQALYIVQYYTLMRSNPELAQQSYKARTKNGTIETTIGAFINQKMNQFKDFYHNSAKSAMNFTKLVRERTNQLNESLGYGLQMEKNWEFE